MISLTFLLSVFVRYNLGPGVAVELEAQARVAELKEVVGSQQGVLRLFAGELLHGSAGKGCDLPEQSTLHVLHPPPGSSSQLLLQEHLAPGGESRQDRLTSLDLSSWRLPATSSGLAVILDEERGTRRGEDQQTRKCDDPAVGAPLNQILLGEYFSFLH
uniref:Ubiquitin-like domain-containing protein n=1 Tax=Cyprinodon variegatus TaxID=28743 RepID=A0A3Q2CPI9_CYPVA